MDDAWITNMTKSDAVSILFPPHAAISRRVKHTGQRAASRDTRHQHFTLYKRELVVLQQFTDLIGPSNTEAAS